MLKIGKNISGTRLPLRCLPRLRSASVGGQLEVPRLRPRVGAGSWMELRAE